MDPRKTEILLLFNLAVYLSYLVAVKIIIAKVGYSDILS